MVIGIDVYTDTSSHSKRTVTAFVSSTNSNQLLTQQSPQTTTAFTKWYSKCMIESKNQNYSEWLHIMFTGALNKFHEKNGSFPDSIFVYRSGLNESQFDTLKEIEIEPMKNAICQIHESYQ